MSAATSEQTPRVVVDVRIPVRTVSEANSHTHWRVRQKRAKEQRHVVMLHLTAHARGKWWHVPATPLVVTITRYSQGLMDTDNLAASQKHVRDSIAAWLLRDDGPTSGVEWRYAQERCKRGEFGVRVRVEQCEQPPRSPMTPLARTEKLTKG